MVMGMPGAMWLVSSAPSSDVTCCVAYVVGSPRHAASPQNLAHKVMIAYGNRHGAIDPLYPRTSQLR